MNNGNDAGKAKTNKLLKRFKLEHKKPVPLGLLILITIFPNYTKCEVSQSSCMCVGVSDGYGKRIILVPGCANAGTTTKRTQLYVAVKDNIILTQSPRLSGFLLLFSLLN